MLQLKKNDINIEEYYTRYGPMVLRRCRQLLRDEDRALDAMQDVGRGENMKAEHRLGYLALIATVAPMVGLLGTVQGMISSFRAIAVCDNTPSPSELAEGISTALFTTFVGLLVAIPALTTYNMLRNRLAQLVLEVDVLSEELMRRFSTKELLRKGP